MIHSLTGHVGIIFIVTSVTDQNDPNQTENDILLLV
jgi:hypothetical protein